MNILMRKIHLRNALFEGSILYRSSDLSKLSRRKANKLAKKYHLEAVVDLRSEDEILHAPDVVPDNVSYYHFPILSSEENPSVNSKTRLHILKERMNYEGGSSKFLCDTYKRMVSSELALESYQKIFELLKSGKTILYHCTQGKDRTGMITTLIMMSRGISKKEILKDYMEYNDICKTKTRFIRFFVSLLYGKKMGDSLYNLLICKEEYLNAAFEEMEEKYGSMEAYLNSLRT